MSTIVSKILSRANQAFTGVNVNATLLRYEDMQGSLSALAQLACIQKNVVPVSDWEEHFSDISSTPDCAELAAFFTAEKSDKATKHNYHLIYASVLAGKRQETLAIWEIGLGTNDPSHASSMGVDGKPGASVRAFASWAPHAQIYGADNDPGTLFQEERITTFFLDQTVPETFTTAFAKLPPHIEFELIIDDGLHTPWANLNTINFALTKLKKGGTLVIEDILPQYLPWWTIAVSLLSEKYSCRLIQMKEEMVCVITLR